MIETEILVIGSGMAGLSSAIYLARSGCQVIIVTKSDDPLESNSVNAQGGIIYKGEDDSPEKLAEDIIEAGSGLCFKPAVNLLASQGPATVEDLLLNIAKVPFTQENEKLHLTAEGGHSLRRIIHHEDSTGASLIQSLYAIAKKEKNITFASGKIAIDLITREHHSLDTMAHYKKPECFGAYLLDCKTRKIETYLAKAVILATGGLGEIFRHSTNPEIATGDGFAMAIRAGAILINMEYTQFHPTTLFHPDANRFLISEAVRGEGGILVTQDGKKFMAQYHPKGSLAPRDVVTRAILEELIARNEQFVNLDLSALSKQEIMNRFPSIYSRCLEYNIDITSRPIPVVPAFHFSCGGIRVNSNGRTNLRRLYAIGEVSCTGVHGANRLASTSLLECCVWGKRSADHFIKHRNQMNKEKYPEIPDWEAKGLKEDYDPALLAQDWASLKNIMWNYVGPVRSTRRLQRAFADLRHLQSEIEEFYRNTKLTRAIVELRNAVTVGLSIAGAAWRNKKSEGCHYRKD